MRHFLMGGFGRRFAHSDDLADRRHGGHHHHHEHRRGGRRGRAFDYGELRLVVLDMIAEQPRHGYELIKAIEERMGGSYSPSPGVIYPTLAWLEDSGFTVAEAEESGRKRYRITPEGEAFLAANKASIKAMAERFGYTDGFRGGIPAPVVRAMGNLRMALRLRLRAGGLDSRQTQIIADALDRAAKLVEES